jgi:hypothetical protein
MRRRGQRGGGGWPEGDMDNLCCYKGGEPSDKLIRRRTLFFSDNKTTSRPNSRLYTVASKDLMILQKFNGAFFPCVVLSFDR